MRVWPTIQLQEFWVISPPAAFVLSFLNHCSFLTIWQENLRNQMLRFSWSCTHPRQQCYEFLLKSVLPQLLKLQAALKDLSGSEIAPFILLKHQALPNSTAAFLYWNIFQEVVTFPFGWLMCANCCLIWKRCWSRLHNSKVEKKPLRRNKVFWKNA